ncbi:MAG: DUF3187 family protein [Gammaproteobacteria bacterium]|nr:DUF3187 family protein [Gammaproteobacteria bacterium]
MATRPVERPFPGARCAHRLAIVLVAVIAPVAHGEPLLTRNQNPLLLPYGLPNPLPARLPAHRSGGAALVVNWTNAANDDFSDAHSFTLDAEAVDVRVRLEYAFAPDWAGLVELPWRDLSGGTLDAFIENWHDFFGLPKGPRHHMPQDRLLIEYQQGDKVELRFDESSSGIGDIPIAAGYQITSSDKGAIAGWLTVKLPTGDSKDLLGSGATDVALSFSGQTQLAEHWQVFGQLDAVWLGQGDILPDYQQSFAWAGLAGVSWNAWRALDLTVQFYANSKVFDTSVDGLSGDAIVLSYGGTWRTTGGWRIDFGMNEDIQVDMSPDATFYVAVQRGF